MGSEVYHFKLGTFKCIAVSDGTFTYSPPTFPPPATLLFYNAPRELLEQTLCNHSMQPENWKEWISPYICLLVNTGEHWVLIDTGAGGLGPNTGRLLQNMKADGIAPESVDTIILTHGHPDHLGGNTLDGGKPAFPNACYIIWKDEWDFWTSKEAEDKLDKHVREVLLGVARKNLYLIRDRLNFIECEGEILPGIQAIAAPGHTPGHMALAISSGGERLLCISDAVLHPIHLEQPEWCTTFDFSPDQVVATRYRILNQAANGKTLVHAFHFPFPGLGYVVQKGKGWQWQPIEIEMMT